MNDLMSYEVCYLRKQKCTEKQNKTEIGRESKIATAFTSCDYFSWFAV